MAKKALCIVLAVSLICCLSLPAYASGSTAAVTASRYNTIDGERGEITHQYELSVTNVLSQTTRTDSRWGQNLHPDYVKPVPYLQCAAPARVTFTSGAPSWIGVYGQGGAYEYSVRYQTADEHPLGWAGSDTYHYPDFYETSSAAQPLLTTGTTFEFHYPGTYEIVLTMPGDENWGARLFITVTGTSVPAVPITQSLYVNSEKVSVEAYAIGGNTYFMLRDLAAILNGTEKQFSVDYNPNTKEITLESGHEYLPTGAECQPGDGLAKIGMISQSAISLDNQSVGITAYTIGGNNFVKLRGLMKLLDVSTEFDEASWSIHLDTAKGYTD